MKSASNKQTWAILCAIKLDVRNIGLNYDEAYSYLDRANKGDREKVRDELLARGAINKGKISSSNGVDFQAIFDTAHRAGMEAGTAHKPMPMTVQQHQSVSDDTSPVVKQWIVDSGVCGFAWIKVRPATSSFARWCIKQELGKTDGYSGGLSIWVHEFGQSYERKMAYASAFAKVLKENKIDAYADGRLD